jgi:hypothetical protein
VSAEEKSAAGERLGTGPVADPPGHVISPHAQYIKADAGTPIVSRPSRIPITAADFATALSNCDCAWTRHALALAVLLRAMDSCPPHTRRRQQIAAEIARHRAGIALAEELQRELADRATWRRWRD